ncbi:acyl-CoA dehydrogenase family protein [Sphingomonas adhaesiva]|uniref:acyl-CoA dehydrogenase family protein n=1 Tax=Sphingomonas adhaesiva TaxID=28212 RepID=UPI002FF5A31D
MTGLTHEDRGALVDSVRRLLADRCTEGDVRRIMDGETGHDPDLWRALAEMGVPGLMIATAQGGAGLGAVELGLVMEEVGAALLPAPLLSCVIAAAALADSDATDLLAGIADGSRIATVAFSGSDDWTGRGDVTVSGDRASGTARFVTDAAIADTILIATDEGVFLPLHTPQVTVLPVFDRTRRMADVTFDGAVRRVGDAAAVRAMRDLAIVALAGEQAGIARRVLEMTVGYAAERHQFGRAIGSFQAVKHMAADLLLESESATSAARDAAEQLAAGSAEKDAAVALAAFACADAAVRCTKDAIQMHGGIAFTWAHPAHLYLRRARSAAQLFGAPPLWRDRYLTALEAVA